MANTNLPIIFLPLPVEAQSQHPSPGAVAATQKSSFESTNEPADTPFTPVSAL